MLNVFIEIFGGFLGEKQWKDQSSLLGGLAFLVDRFILLRVLLF